MRGFARVPHALTFDRRISDGAKVLYALLQSYARGRGECAPTHRRVMADLGISQREAIYRTRELERSGWITSEPTVGGPSLIRICTPPGVAQICKGGLHENARGGCTKSQDGLHENATPPTPRILLLSSKEKELRTGGENARAEIASPDPPENPELEAAADLAEKLFPLLSFGSKVRQFGTIYPPSWFRPALEVTASRGIRDWAYVHKILMRYEAQGGPDPPPTPNGKPSSNGNGKPRRYDGQTNMPPDPADVARDAAEYRRRRLEGRP